MRARFGAISRGTERAGPGRPGAGERVRAHARAFHGRRVSVPGEIRLCHGRRGRSRTGRTAGPRGFRLHPHQSLFTVPADAVFAVPADVPPRRAVLAANMETALNAVWDGGPGPADRIAVVGGGLVGVLVAYLCARMPGARGDAGRYRARARARLAQALGARFASPERRAGGLRSRLSRQRHARPGLRPRCGSPARRRPCSN